MSNADFVNQIYQAALAAGLTDAAARVTASQAAVESDYGNAAPGNNFFGIKAGKDWTGATQKLWTNEVVDGKTERVQQTFRAYPTPEAGLADRVAFMADKFPSFNSATTVGDAYDALQNGKYGRYATLAPEKYEAALSSVNQTYLGGTPVPPSDVPTAVASELSVDRPPNSVGSPDDRSLASSMGIVAPDPSPAFRNTLGPVNEFNPLPAPAPLSAPTVAPPMTSPPGADYRPTLDAGGNYVPNANRLRTDSYPADVTSTPNAAYGVLENGLGGVQDPRTAALMAPQSAPVAAPTAAETMAEQGPARQQQDLLQIVKQRAAAVTQAQKQAINDVSKVAAASPAPTQAQLQAMRDTTNADQTAAPVPMPGRPTPLDAQPASAAPAVQPAAKTIRVGKNNYTIGDRFTTGGYNYEVTDKGIEKIGKVSTGQPNLLDGIGGQIVAGAVTKAVDNAAPTVAKDLSNAGTAITTNASQIGDKVTTGIKAVPGLVTGLGNSIANLFGGGAKPPTVAPAQWGWSDLPPTPSAPQAQVVAPAPAKAQTVMPVQTPNAIAASYGPATTKYTVKQMEVPNPAYQAYIQAQGADDIGAGPGSFSDLQNLVAPAAAPPRTITTQVVTPVVVAPAQRTNSQQQNAPANNNGGGTPASVGLGYIKSASTAAQAQAIHAQLMKQQTG